jgi:hypothetical protein
MKVMLLQSVDGQEWAHVVMYPETWTADHAHMQAIEAFNAAQVKHPDEWEWKQCEPELLERGFVIPICGLGPTWDLNR